MVSDVDVDLPDSMIWASADDACAAGEIVRRAALGELLRRVKTPETGDSRLS